MRVITDLHCHLLPGVDDGPPTMAAALDLAREHVRQGVGRVVATPHCNVRLPTSVATIVEGVAELRAALAEAGIPLIVEAGAEVAAAHLPDLDLAELAGLTLGDGSWVLLEAPLTAEFPIERAAQDLMDEGYHVLLAHPERCALFLRAPDRVRELVEAGARVSVTAAALAGGFGRPPREQALAWVEAGLVHNAASDAHDVLRRPPRLLSDVQAAGLADRIEFWCADTPDALVGPPPAPPSAPAPAAGPPVAEAAAAPDAAPDPDPDPQAEAAAMAAAGAGPQEIEDHLAVQIPRTAARRIVRRLLRDDSAADI
jgi:protein-tyrosine phosphatase